MVAIFVQGGDELNIALTIEIFRLIQSCVSYGAVTIITMTS